MHITLRQLRYFAEVAQCRSFSRASEHLSIAQPALSQNIAALEEDLGAKLFKRHARGVDLTPAGLRLLAGVADVLARTDALKDLAAGRDARPSGVVRLSIAGSVAGVIVAPLLRAATLQFPEIELNVREGLSFETRAQVESGQSHLVVMPSPAELQGMEALTLFEERFTLFGAPEQMRRMPKEMPLARVAGLALAAPDGAHDLRKIIERAAGQIGVRLDVRHELNSPQMLIAVVREGLAFAILPPSACVDALAAKSIVGRPVVAPELSRVQAVVWPRDRPLAPAAVAIRDTLVQVVGELLLAGRLQGRTGPVSHRKK